MSDPSVREFEFSESDFQRVRSLIRSRTGIELGANKQSLVYGRLARRIRMLRLSTFREYLELVADDGAAEAGAFVNAITTNVTEFFRENHHFDYMVQTLLPALWRRAETTGRRVRIWSAGCSTGEEPYSIAMILRENMPQGSSWNIKILATDLDTDVLAHAREGVYTNDRLERVSPARLDRHFEPVSGGAYRAREALRSLITFNQLNLMEPWPMRGRFDVIFCRNVVIYFDDVTKTNLVRRYREALNPDGHLFLGHSESLVSSSMGFEGCGKTIYRRSDTPATRAA